MRIQSYISALVLAAVPGALSVACSPSPAPAHEEAHEASAADANDAAAAPRVRFATYNTSLYRTTAGALASELVGGKSTQAQGVARILRSVRPDIVLLNEFDWDAEGKSAQSFHDEYLMAADDGTNGAPLDLAYHYVATSNTGIPSGFDLDRSGSAGGAPGTVAYGNDSLGYGIFPGQYSFVVFSRYPIDAEQIRSFQKFLWKDMPGAQLPDFADSSEPNDWYGADALAVLRLSSKNHVDVPIRIGNDVVHILASHPTPPGFDGAEGRNDKRNHDELRLWADYIGGSKGAYLKDDNGVAGGLADGSRFVIVGDLNSDPNDGDVESHGITQLLASENVTSTFVPKSEGALAASKAQAGANAKHGGDPAEDTADFSDKVVGNLRFDYVLPSRNMTVNDGAVIWPASTDPLAATAASVSDHHLVWLDVSIH